MALSSRYFLMCLVLLVSSFLGGCSVQKEPLSNKVEVPAQDVAVLPQVCFQSTCRGVEVADEPEEQMKGLMERTHMDEDKGMLFVFNRVAAWPFWMKDTLISLDMIRLDETGTVVYIHRDVPPCTDDGDQCPAYGPKDPVAKYVLELDAGQAEKHALSLGSVLTLPN